MVMLFGDVEKVMMPAGWPAPQRDLRGDAEIVAVAEGCSEAGHTVVSICAGAMLAARAGLLDGYACTTHYLDCEELARVAPAARVVDNRLFVEDRDRFTSAGVTAGIDLMLYMVSRKLGHAMAAAIARYLVVYLRRGGAEPEISPWLEEGITFIRQCTGFRTRLRRIRRSGGLWVHWRGWRARAAGI